MQANVRFGIVRSTTTVLSESLVVGLLFVVLAVLVTAIYNEIVKQDRLPLDRVAVVTFFAAVLGHWFFEFFGLNEYFCKYADYS